MADQAEQVSTTGLVDTKQQPGASKPRQYSEALKRQMVAETQAPGASVSIVARRHECKQQPTVPMAAAAVAEGRLRLAVVRVRLRGEGPSRDRRCAGSVPAFYR